MTLTLYTPLYTPTNFFTSFDNDMRHMSHILRSVNQQNDEDDTTQVYPNYRVKMDKQGRKMIELEMPGVKKQHIDIELVHQGRVLSVEGKRFHTTKLFENEKEKKEDDAEVERKPTHVYKWKDRLYGNVEMEDVEAEYIGDGILRIVVKPKQASKDPVKIEISQA